MSCWPMVKLGEVLRRSTVMAEVDPAAQYNEVTVKLWGKGAVLRGVVSGGQLIDQRRFVARAGQFIFSKIDARNGALALVPDDLEGALVTNDFPLFDIDTSRMDAAYLGWLARSRDFVARCLKASEGTTNRVRLQEERFLSMEIPLPPLAEQRRIVAWVENVTDKAVQSMRMSSSASVDISALMIAATNAKFSNSHSRQYLGNVSAVIDPNPSHRYPAYLESDGIPIISSSDFIGADHIDVSSCRRVPDEFYESTVGRHGVTGGDLIFSRKGKIGYARLHPANTKLAMTHTLCVIKPDRDRIEPRYLLHFARSREFIGYLNGTMNPNLGVPTLGLNVIRAAEIPLPPLPEQRRIVAELDALQAKVAAVKALQDERTAALQALLPSILDRAFGGRV